VRITFRTRIRNWESLWKQSNNVRFRHGANGARISRTIALFGDWLSPSTRFGGSPGDG
jgi:hypothetical protein